MPREDENSVGLWACSVVNLPRRWSERSFPLLMSQIYAGQPHWQIHCWAMLSQVLNLQTRHSNYNNYKVQRKGHLRLMDLGHWVFEDLGTQDDALYWQLQDKGHPALAIEPSVASGTGIVGKPLAAAHTNIVSHLQKLIIQECAASF